MSKVRPIIVQLLWLFLLKIRLVQSPLPVQMDLFCDDYCKYIKVNDSIIETTLDPELKWKDQSVNFTVKRGDRLTFCVRNSASNMGIAVWFKVGDKQIFSTTEHTMWSVNSAYSWTTTYYQTVNGHYIKQLYLFGQLNTNYEFYFVLPADVDYLYRYYLVDKTYYFEYLSQGKIDFTTWIAGITSDDIQDSNNMIQTWSVPSIGVLTSNTGAIMSQFTKTSSMTLTYTHASGKFDFEVSFEYQLWRYTEYIVSQSSKRITIVVCGRNCNLCDQQSRCPSCKAGYFYKEGITNQCFWPSEMPKNYYRDNDTYRPCHGDCATCNVGPVSGNTNCITCNSLLLYWGNCYDKCTFEPAIYLGENYETKECDNCKSKDLYLLNKKCVAERPGGMFIQEPNYYNYLEQCYNTCESCNERGDQGKHNCERCHAGLLFLEKNCIQRCGDYYYEDIENRNCVNCKELPQPSYFNPRLEHCVNEKYVGTFVDVVNDRFNVITECHRNCWSCNELGDSTSNKCTKCLNGELPDSDGNCPFLECPEYLVEENGKCINCKYWNKYSLEGKCVSEIPSNAYTIPDLFEDFHFIKICHAKCARCSMGGNDYKNNCDTCINGLVLDNYNNCVDNCPRYSAPVNDECIICKTSLKYYYNKECYEECPENTVMSNYVCISREICPFHCFNEGEHSVDETTNKCSCICKEQYEGDYCEITKVNKDIEIIPFQNKPVKYSEINTFTYTLSNDLKLSLDSKVFWSLNSDTDNTASLNGYTEDYLKWKPNTVSNDSTIKLTVTDGSKSYTASYNIKFDEIDVKEFGTEIFYDNSDNFGYAFSTSVWITVHYPSNEESNVKIEYKYNYYYLNKYNEYIPLSGEEDYTGLFFDYWPMTKETMIEIIDSYNQISYTYVPVSIWKNEVDNTWTWRDLLNGAHEADEADSGRDTNMIWTLNKWYSHIIEHVNNEEISQEIEKWLQILEETLVLSVSRENKGVVPWAPLQLMSLIIEFQDLSYEMIKRLNSIIESALAQVETEIPQKSLFSFYRNIELLITSLNKWNVNNGEHLSLLNKWKGEWMSWNDLMSQTIISGEVTKIQNEHFETNIIKWSRTQNSLKIKHFKLEELRNWNTYAKEAGNSPCNIGDILCIDDASFTDIKNDLLYLKNTNINNVSFNWIELRKSYIVFNNEKLETVSPITLVPSLYNSETRTKIDNLHKIKYNINIPVQYIGKTSWKGSNENERCVSQGTINGCKTYYDYDNNIITCKCEGLSEISWINHKDVAAYLQEYQYPSLKTSKLNKITICFLSAMFMFLSTFTVVFARLDYIEDTMQMEEESDAKYNRMKNTFSKMKFLAGATVLELAWYYTSYIYSILGVANVHNYSNPRHIRLYIEIISFLSMILLSMIPFLVKSFDYKDEIISAMSVEKENLDIYNLPLRLIDVGYTLLYIVLANIIVNFIFGIVLCVFSTHNNKSLLKKKWNWRRELVTEYTSKHVTIDNAKKSKFNLKFVNRLWSFYNFYKIYKSSLLKKFTQNYENIEIEMQEMSSCYEKTNEDNAEEIANAENVNVNVKKQKVYSFNQKSDLIEISINSDTSTPAGKNKKEHKESKREINLGNKSDSLIINDVPTEDIDSESDYVDSNYSIQQFNCYSFFNITPNITEIKTQKEEKWKRISSVFTTLCLLVFIGGLFTLFVWFFPVLFNKYGIYILKSWFYPIWIYLILIRFMINFLVNIVVVAYVNCSLQAKKAGNVFHKIVYRFIPDYLVDIIDIKYIVTRYKNVNTSQS